MKSKKGLIKAKQLSRDLLKVLLNEIDEETLKKLLIYIEGKGFTMSMALLIYYLDAFIEKKKDKEENMRLTDDHPASGPGNAVDQNWATELSLI